MCQGDWSFRYHYPPVDVVGRENGLSRERIDQVLDMNHLTVNQRAALIERLRAEAEVILVRIGKQ